MKYTGVLPLLVMLISLTADPVFAENPLFENGTLTIPSVDTPEQVGMYQDVKLELTEQGGWNLVDLNMADTPPVYKSTLTTVEAIVTKAFPTQVFLRVNGYFNAGCYSMGKIVQRLENNCFEVVVYYEGPQDPYTTSCTGDYTTYEKFIPLSVYGLNAGTYEYKLSDAVTQGPDGPIITTLTGSFTLDVNNEISSVDEVETE